jgi:hypothetical protein
MFRLAESTGSNLDQLDLAAFKQAVQLLDIGLLEAELDRGG